MLSRARIIERLLQEVYGDCWQTERVLLAVAHLTNECLTRKLGKRKAPPAPPPAVARVAPGLLPCAAAADAAFFALLNRAFAEASSAHFRIAWHAGSAAQSLVDVDAWTCSFERSCPALAGQLRSVMLACWDVEKRKADDPVLVRKRHAVLVAAMTAHRHANRRVLVAAGMCQTAALAAVGQASERAIRQSALPVAASTLRAWLRDREAGVVAAQVEAASAELELSASFDNFQKFTAQAFQRDGQSSTSLHMTVRALARHRQPLFRAGTLFRNGAGAVFVSIGMPRLLDGDAFRVEYTVRPAAAAAARSDGVVHLQTAMPWPRAGWDIQAFPGMNPMPAGGLTYLRQQIPAPPRAADMSSYLAAGRAAGVHGILLRCGSSLRTAGRAPRGGKIGRDGRARAAAWRGGKKARARGGAAARPAPPQAAGVPAAFVAWLKSLRPALLASAGQQEAAVDGWHDHAHAVRPGPASRPRVPAP